MFKKILVCLDGSKMAEKILPYAAEQAHRFRSSIVLFQSVPGPVIVTPGIPGVAPGVIETKGMVQKTAQALNDARDYLEGIAAPLRERGIKVETVTMPGNAPEAIVNYARTNNIEMIALVTHGHGGLAKAVFGSVADYVLRHSELPILLIKPNYVRPEDRPEPETKL